MSAIKVIGITVASLLVSILALLVGFRNVTAEGNTVFAENKQFNFTFDEKSKGQSIDLTEKLKNEFGEDKRCQQPNTVCTSGWDFKIQAKRTTTVHRVTLTDYSMDPKDLRFVEDLPDEVGLKSPSEVIYQMQWILGKRGLFLDPRTNKPHPPTGNPLGVTRIALLKLSCLKGQSLLDAPKLLSQELKKLRQNYIELGQSYFDNVVFHGEEYVVPDSCQWKKEYEEELQNYLKAQLKRAPQRIEMDLKNENPQVQGSLKVE